MNNNINSDPELDPSVLQQMVYQRNYTESINKQMRVPDTITVAESEEKENGNDEATGDFQQSSSNAPSTYSTHPAFSMEVPERIVVSVGERGVQYKQGEAILPSATYSDDLVISQPTPALQTPPRVLTLQDKNFDSLDVNTSNARQHMSHADDSTSGSAFENTDVDLCSQSNSRPTRIFENDIDQLPEPSRSLLENLHVESTRLYREVVAKLQMINGSNKTDNDCVVERHDAIYRSPMKDFATLEDFDDVSVMRKQVFKLHERIAALEQQQANRSKIDTIVYGVSVAIWLLNGWFLYTRRLY